MFLQRDMSPVSICLYLQTFHLVEDWNFMRRQREDRKRELVSNIHSQTVLFDSGIDRLLDIHSLLGFPYHHLSFIVNREHNTLGELGQRYSEGHDAARSSTRNQVDARMHFRWDINLYQVPRMWDKVVGPLVALLTNYFLAVRQN